MTAPADPVAEYTRLLVTQAGGYLRNIIREPMVTCMTCGAPVDGWDQCFPCRRHQDVDGIADLVVPLTYAVDRAQSGILVRHYKDDISAQARARHSRVIRRLLYLGLMKHQQCIEKRMGRRVNARVTVPSLRNRAGVHPFTAIARAMNAVDDRLALTASASATGERTLSASHFHITPEQRLDGKHILVLDDTWTTGANTQSAALTLRRAGAAHISILVIGRWISPSYGPNAAFIRQRLHRDYDPAICPVTGGRCPA